MDNVLIGAVEWRGKIAHVYFLLLFIDSELAIDDKILLLYSFLLFIIRTNYESNQYNNNEMDGRPYAK